MRKLAIVMKEQLQVRPRAARLYQRVWAWRVGMACIPLTSLRALPPLATTPDLDVAPGLTPGPQCFMAASAPMLFAPQPC